MSEERQQFIAWINEAVAAGARRAMTCREVELSVRTWQRWQTSPEDRRTTVVRPAPANRLSVEEEQQIRTVCHHLEYASLPPSQIVPRLADKGFYLASESTFYRVLRRCRRQLAHRRGRVLNRGTFWMEFIVSRYQQLTMMDALQLFSIRKRVFKTRLKWAVRCIGEFEFDEYDNAHAVYLLGMRRERIVCGVRFIASRFTTMLSSTFNHAFRPEALPSGDYIEASRLFVDKDALAASGSGQSPVSVMLFLSMIKYARLQGVEGLYSVVSPQMYVLLRRAGWAVDILGSGWLNNEEEIHTLYMPAAESTIETLNAKVPSSQGEGRVNFYQTAIQVRT
ncbi:acyl-homoserine-lactone synthase [Serratia liquefaciens]|uniref:acyl-homoserine-lactone synthase n=1 Tax=Serratia liquefaciens TaxID=614 RepID=UPI00102039EC|nr:acyl-homoserine-lactone synthase [Serratia liquefaciens]